MSRPQYEAKFGEVYRGVDLHGNFDNMIVMVIGTVEDPGVLDYWTLFLSEHQPPVSKWGLYKEHWQRVDE